MPRLDATAWAAIRAEYEAGASVASLSKAHGVSRPAIDRRAAKEGWVQDPTEAVDRLVAAKVAGVVAGCTPQKKAEALDAAADRRASVVTRHQREWDAHQRLIDAALAASDFDKAKLAKITAETIRIRQDGERKAWGLDKPAADAPGLTIAWPLPKGPLDR